MISNTFTILLAIIGAILVFWLVMNYRITRDWYKSTQSFMTIMRDANELLAKRVAALEKKTAGIVDED